MSHGSPGRRVVVLGGGGVAGIAWMVGVVAGLQRNGVDLAVADGFIGTSAGSVVGTQLAHGIPVEQLLADQLQPPAGSQETFRAYSQADADAQNRQLLAKVGGDLNAARRRIGAFALRSQTVPVATRRAIIASRLPAEQWPQRDLGIVAVDAESGTHRLFDRNSDVPLVDAVMASCAVPGVWPVVQIDGQSFMDGGMRSMTNADLAADAARVVVLAPLGTSDDNPVSGHLRAEAAQLQAAGCVVTVVVPDAASLLALGDNVLDPARRAPSAGAGLAQGLALAPTIASGWTAAA